MISTRFWSGSETIVIPFSLRILSDFFFVRMWFLCECLRFTFPEAVNRKRFLAPEWDFIFGMAGPELKRGAYVPQGWEDRQEPADRGQGRFGAVAGLG
jgi:hypothetical protein